MNLPYFIVEIGNLLFDAVQQKNAEPLKTAKECIDIVADVEADCVGISMYKAQDRMKRIFDFSEYRELSDYAHQKNVEIAIYPVDYETADFLSGVVDYFKIPTLDTKNLSLLEYIGQKGKPVCLSTGAAYLSMVDEAVRILKNAGCKNILLLHRVESYPMKTKDANLCIITTLKEAFPDIRVGYSDHMEEKDTITALTAAYILGAEVIEKTLVYQKEFEKGNLYNREILSDAIYNLCSAKRMLGSGEKKIYSCEI